MSERRQAYPIIGLTPEEARAASYAMAAAYAQAIHAASDWAARAAYDMNMRLVALPNFVRWARARDYRA